MKWKDARNIGFLVLKTAIDSWRKVRESMNETEQTIKHRWLRRPIVVLTLLVTAAFLLFVMLEPKPITVSMEQSNNWGWDPKNELFELKALFQFPDSPYIYCQFIGGRRGSYGPVVTLIDREIGKRVLYGEFHNEHDLVSANRIIYRQVSTSNRRQVSPSQRRQIYRLGSRREWTFRQVTLLDSQPVIALRYDVNVSPKWLKWIPSTRWNIPSFLFTDFQEHWILDLSGARRTESISVLKNSPDYRPGNWPYPQNFKLENGIRFAYHFDTEKYTFTHSKLNKPIKAFSAEEISSVLPGLNQPMDSLDFRRVNNPPGDPLLLCVSNVPGFPLLEIQYDRIFDSGVSDIFFLAGEGLEEYPIIALNQNRTVIAYNYTSTIDRTPSLVEPVLYYYERNMYPGDGPGSLRLSTKTLWDEREPIQLSTRLDNDGRLLFYRDATIWTVGSDGSGEKRVFPLEQ